MPALALVGCGGMYTANTMATAIEVMGMSLPGSSSHPAESAEKKADIEEAGRAVAKMLVKWDLNHQIS